MHLNWWWLDRRVYEYFAVNVGPLLGWSNPILVYQMGKVASSTIRNSLFKCRDPATRLVLMSHEFYPLRNRKLERIDLESERMGEVVQEIEHARAIWQSRSRKERMQLRLREKYYSEKIYKNYVKKGKVRVITLVRDPVENNISMFFQLIDEYVSRKMDRNHLDVNKLTEIFLKRYVHTRPINWLDAELKTTLGVDVYQFHFPREEGVGKISTENVDLLVMKVEIADEAKCRAIKEFLKLEELQLTRSNIAIEKDYGSSYTQFKKAIRLPDELLERLYNSKYAQHFYTPSELESFRRRWSE